MIKKIVGPPILDNAKNIPEIRKQVYDLFKEDYVLFNYKDNVNYFMKREKFLDIYKLIDGVNWKKYNKLFYGIEKKSSSKRMIVFFASMPSNFTTHSVMERHAFKNASFLIDQVSKDTVIMRIADFNRSLGSFYRNTSNYVDYENDVMQAIEEEAKVQNIDKDNIVFFGTSKGATAALYYGVNNNYKFVANDPILSLVNSDKNRQHFCYLDDMDPSLLPNDNKKEEYNSKGIIITSESSPGTYNVICENFLNRNQNIQIYNINNPGLTHVKIFREAISLNIGLVNMLLHDTYILR